MIDYAALVAALREELGIWQAVADACNGDALTHGAGYYHQIESGRIKNPSKQAKEGIRLAVASAKTLLKLPRLRAQRGGLVCRLSLRAELQKLRKRKCWTWDQTLDEALVLLLDKYPEVDAHV